MQEKQHMMEIKKTPVGEEFQLLFCLEMMNNYLQLEEEYIPFYFPSLKKINEITTKCRSIKNNRRIHWLKVVVLICKRRNGITKTMRVNEDQPKYKELQHCTKTDQFTLNDVTFINKYHIQHRNFTQKQ